ncbi:MAG: sulfatase [Melioribacteraceae bacterium]|nr:sulfatase [Melioribacteraceae bacterium]
MFTFRKFTIIIVFIVATTGINSCISPDENQVNQKIQKNILLIISDDHGKYQLGCYGNDKIKTPNLDKLAEEGVRFNNAFAVSASCTASRGTILSGLYPHSSGLYGHAHKWHHFSFLNYVETLPQLLKKNGYKTGIIGKKHVAPDSKFPFYLEVKSDEIMGNRDVFTMAKKASEFFNSDKENPFLLVMGYSDPHRVFGTWKHSLTENWLGFGNDFDYPGIEPIKYDTKDVVVPGYLPDVLAVREELTEQYESISRMDKGVGLLIKELKESGRFENTLIIYISDNGIPFPGAKTTLYDSGLNMPMIVVSPSIKEKGKFTNAFISFTDITPTILDWTNSNGPDYELPGKSFLSVLNKENPDGWDEVYQSHTFHEITMYYPMRGIRNQKYHLIHNLFPELEFPFATDLYSSKTWQAILDNKMEYMGKRSVKEYLMRPEFELYDIEKDPNETLNLAYKKEYSAIKKELYEKLHNQRVKTDDRWLLNEKYSKNKTLY